MFFLIRMLFKLIIFVVVIAAIVGVGYWVLLPAGSALPPFPEVATYEIVAGEDISDAIADLETNHPSDITTRIADLAQMTRCYQDLGGMRVQFYRHSAEVLKAGAVAMASQNTLSNPGNLINCLGSATQEDLPAAGAQIQQLSLSLCQANYTLPKEEDTIHIIYIGTTPDLCQAFCAQLEGCVAHRP